MQRWTTVTSLLLMLVAPASASLAQAGSRTATCRGVPATVADHRGVIHGTPGDDVIIGDDGPNTIYGNGGWDQVCAGGGADRVEQIEPGGLQAVGGPGPDTLIGGNGINYLSGNAGADQLRGGSDLDFLGGGAGNDELAGFSGNDELHGGRGDDVLQGGPDNDYCDGDSGINEVVDCERPSGSSTGLLADPARPTFGSVGTTLAQLATGGGRRHGRPAF